MTNPVNTQLWLFFASLVFGGGIGVFYVLLGLLRRKRKHVPNALADTVFWAVSSPAIFVFFMRVNGGDVRGYMLVSMLFGACAVAVGRYFLFGEGRALRKRK